jgi:hypothetical protein
VIRSCLRSPVAWLRRSGWVCGGLALWLMSGTRGSRYRGSPSCQPASCASARLSRLFGVAANAARRARRGRCH